MRGVKGCFVCGRDHRAKTRHPREEVTAAINRLKSKHPTAWLTVDDLAAVFDMAMVDDESNPNKEPDAQWAEDDELGDIEEDLRFMEETGSQVERALASSAFLHGSAYSTTLEVAIKEMQNQLDSEGNGAFNGVCMDPGAISAMMSRDEEHPAESFDGLRIDTCANRSSDMSLGQYKLYVRKFGLPEAIRQAEARAIKEIGGRQLALGAAKVQILLPRLGMVADVEVLIIEQDIPTFLSMKDMLDHGLDISVH